MRVFSVCCMSGEHAGSVIRTSIPERVDPRALLPSTVPLSSFKQTLNDKHRAAMPHSLVTRADARYLTAASQVPQAK